MKFQKLLILFSGIILLNSSCNAQNSTNEGVSQDGIKWMSFEQAVAKEKNAPKKIFIDISTDWCGWCKKMDASTFMDTAVIRYMNENFYAVRLNAETRDTIQFMDKQFVFLPEYKANELALSLLSGKMSYPSFVFMNEKVEILSPLAGYQTVPQLMQVLTFFGSNAYLNMKWDEYQNAPGK
jgi:thioredoxin-related protein